ncbi:MAG: hypothetical protein IPN69_16925 [Acidobacteria bacterium]|nr:hypothetical protein [Acidobacteriota bacterium]
MPVPKRLSPTGSQDPDSRSKIPRIPNPDSKFQIPDPNSRFQNFKGSRLGSRIALQSRRVGTICGSGWLVAALADRSIDTNLSSTIRYRRWYRLVPTPHTKNPWVFQSSRFKIPD